MKQTFFLLALCLLGFCATAQDIDESAISDQYIVHLYSDARSDDFIKSYPQAQIVKCLSQTMNIWLLQSGDKNLVQEMYSNKAVKAVQHNHDNVKRRLLIPDDTYFGNLWNMHNLARPGADISAPEAWDINHSAVTQTGDSIVIAIIDGPFDLYHEDLNFFVNKNEIPYNGIDDDGNGYIDDYKGWNVFMNNDSVYALYDEHGTHVAGIAAAIGNNAKGVAGVCWGAKILAVDGSSTLESDVIIAYDYVIEMRRLYDQTNGAKGAFIVATNSSFGVDRGKPVNYPIWCALYDSLGHYGILSACATANNNYNVDVVGDIPTQCPSKWMIGVTNTTASDTRSLSAAYGPASVDIGAPGSGIYSCYPGSTYGGLTGTSMATPHISGAVAALFAYACPRLMQDYFAYPDSIALLMRDYIYGSADRLTTLSNVTSTGGRLNLYHAYLAESAYNCNNCNYNVSLASQNPICQGDSTGAIVATASATSGGYHYLWSNGDSADHIATLKAGFYQLTVTDSAGCQRSVSTIITQPAPIKITNIAIVPITASNPGNVVLTVTAGNDTLTYQMDADTFQRGAIFVVDTPGVHHFRIRNAYGCELDTTVSLFYTGISDLSAISYFSIAPNPSSGISEVMIKADRTYDAQLVLTDLTGRIITQQSLAISTGLQRKPLDLTGVADGIYILSISAQGQTLSSQKVSVIR